MSQHTMEDESGRQAACDRCRGQKLRCVGVINPIFKSRSRLQRSEVPCERCVRAKVVCYSIRPALRRTLTSDAHNDKTISFIPGSLSDPDGPPSGSMSPAAPRSASKAPQRIDQFSVQNHQQITSTGSEQSLEVEETGSDVATSATGIGASAMATSEWLAHFHDSNPGWCDLGMDLPIPNGRILHSDLRAYGEGGFGFKDIAGGEYGTMGLGFGRDGTTSNIDQERESGLPQAVLSATQGPPMEIDRASTIAESQMWRHRKKNGEKSESKQLCVHDLAKLNEVLLREEGYGQTTSAREGCGWPSPAIGKTLQHSQDLISICRRLESACYNAHSTEAQSSEWSYSDEDQNFDDFRVSQGQVCQINNLPGISSHEEHDSFDAWDPRKLTPMAPTVSILEIPTRLLMLSCYAHILQSFNRIFLPILDAVTTPRPCIPATLAGLHLDGFKLAGHHNLQLKCLIQVSFSLLDKLESSLIGSQGQEGLLSQDRGSLLAGLTDALYEQNAGDGRGEARAKTLIRKIEVALKAIDDL